MIQFVELPVSSPWKLEEARNPCFRQEGQSGLRIGSRFRLPCTGELCCCPITCEAAPTCFLPADTVAAMLRVKMTTVLTGFLASRSDQEVDKLVKFTLPYVVNGNPGQAIPLHDVVLGHIAPMLGAEATEKRFKGWVFEDVFCKLFRSSGGNKDDVDLMVKLGGALLAQLEDIPMEVHEDLVIMCAEVQSAIRGFMTFLDPCIKPATDTTSYADVQALSDAKTSGTNVVSILGCAVKDGDAAQRMTQFLKKAPAWQEYGPALQKHANVVERVAEKRPESLKASMEEFKAVFDDVEKYEKALPDGSCSYLVGRSVDAMEKIFGWLQEDKGNSVDVSENLALFEVLVGAAGRVVRFDPRVDTMAINVQNAIGEDSAAKTEKLLDAGLESFNAKEEVTIDSVNTLARLISANATGPMEGERCAKLGEAMVRVLNFGDKAAEKRDKDTVDLITALIGQSKMYLADDAKAMVEISASVQKNLVAVLIKFDSFLELGPDPKVPPESGPGSDTAASRQAVDDILESEHARVTSMEKSVIATYRVLGKLGEALKKVPAGMTKEASYVQAHAHFTKLGEHLASSGGHILKFMRITGNEMLTGIVDAMATGPSTSDGHANNEHTHTQVLHERAGKSYERESGLGRAHKTRRP